VRVKRRRSGVRLQLDEVEAQLLGQLLDQLDELVEEMDRSDVATRRLFPDGYRGDEAAASDFRELTEQSLREERHDRYGRLRAMLPLGGGDVVVDDETAPLWLTGVNDMRLALGTRLGVTEDGPIEADEELEVGPELVYHWLSALQDSLVVALMG
jgi:hypothetical protein